MEVNNPERHVLVEIDGFKLFSPPMTTSLRRTEDRTITVKVARHHTDAIGLVTGSRVVMTWDERTPDCLLIQSCPFVLATNYKFYLRRGYGNFYFQARNSPARVLFWWLGKDIYIPPRVEVQPNADGILSIVLHCPGLYAKLRVNEPTDLSEYAIPRLDHVGSDAATTD